MRRVLRELCGKSCGKRAEMEISEHAAAEACGNLTESFGKLDEGLSEGPCVSIRTCMILRKVAEGSQYFLSIGWVVGPI